MFNSGKFSVRQTREKIRGRNQRGMERRILRGMEGRSIG